MADEEDTRDVDLVDVMGDDEEGEEKEDED